MSASDPSPQSGFISGTVAGRFVIERSLGSGGMGEVYLATDTVLHRRVALKRVAARYRGNQQRSRQLMHEAERCSALNHPNIAAIYDVLQEEGTGELVIVMEYVEGVTLRQSVGHPFDRETFFRIALPCTEAIAAAHEQGIVHGDLKPENIMIARSVIETQTRFASGPPEPRPDTGILKILDFGLATNLKPSAETITESFDAFDDRLRGTVGYMAPEVLRGCPATPAADVFVLGVLFYELLTGKHPFMVAADAITLERTLHREVNITAEQAGGAEIAAVVRKMLAKDVAERYADAREVLADLRRAQAGVPPRLRLRAPLFIVLPLIAMAVAVAVHYFPRHDSVSHYKLIAVLPFRPVDNQARLQALGDGLTETASAKLARIAASEGLQMVTPGDLRNMHGSAEESLDQARRDFGADLAFVPSMEQSGNRVRINFRLVDTATHHELDGDSVVAPADDIFQLEDSTVEGMATLLALKIHRQDRQQLAEHGTENRGAYEDYLKGVGYLRNYDAHQSADNAIAAFQRALSADPKYGLAYAGQGLALWQKYRNTHNSTFVSQAREMCLKAEGLASGLAPPHICLGTLASGTGRYQDAVREFGLAASLDPNDDDAVLGLAEAQKHLNPQEAENTFKRAIAMRPQYWAGYSHLAVFYIDQARYQDAIQQFKLAAEHAPQNSLVFRSLGGTYIYLGQYDEAEQGLRRSIELSPHYTAYSNLGFVYLRQRRFEQATGAFEQALKLGAHDYEIWGHLADAYYWTPGKRELAWPDYRKAITMAEDALKVNPNEYSTHLLIAHYYASLHQRDLAHSHLTEAMNAQNQDQEVFYYAALVSNQLGETGEAIRWLRAALAHGYSPAEIRRDVEFDNLRNNPEVQLLLANPAH